VQLLGSSSAHYWQQRAAKALANLASCSSSNQQAIAQAGAILLLVQLLGSSNSSELIKEAAAALGHLASDDSTSMPLLRQALSLCWCGC
jgi:hypothetical protein